MKCCVCGTCKRYSKLCIEGKKKNIISDEWKKKGLLKHAQHFHKVKQNILLSAHKTERKSS